MPGYWLGFDPETHLRHARLIRQAQANAGSKLTVNADPLPARAVTEITVYAADHAGLFSQIAGALAVAGASIVDAQDPHSDQWHGAGHVLGSGRSRRGAFDAPHRLARIVRVG